MEITKEQLNDMLHAIGYADYRVEGGTYKAYRNHCAYRESKEHWEELVVAGYAEKGSVLDEVVYYITSKGIRYLEKTLLIKII